MKKRKLVMLALLLCFALCACHEPQDTDEPVQENTAITEDSPATTEGKFTEMQEEIDICETVALAEELPMETTNWKETIEQNILSEDYGTEAAHSIEETVSTELESEPTEPEIVDDYGNGDNNTADDEL